jgi:hypothetical protein
MLIIYINNLHGCRKKASGLSKNSTYNHISMTFRFIFMAKME